MSGGGAISGVAVLTLLSVAVLIIVVLHMLAS
jgi:hypothetical protein